MSPFIYALLVGLADTLLGFVGIFTLGLSKKTFDELISTLIAFAAGSLLGGAFFHLIPESIVKIKPLMASVVLITGFLVFLILEELLHWHRCQDSICKTKRSRSYSYLMIIGDFIHNLIDGLVLIGSFLASNTIALVTSLMILLHELPQELGIFAVLVHGGIEEKKSIYYSVLAQSSVLIGIIAGYFFLREFQPLLPYLLSFAAGGFIYISASDLIPEVNNTSHKRVTSTVWIIIGLLFMLAVKLIFD